MKRLFTGLVALAMGFALIGCEASGRLGDDDPDVTIRTDDDRDYEKKTTTVREPDGDVKTKTEIRRD
jgi:hypothetical protein